MIRALALMMTIVAATPALAGDMPSGTVLAPYTADYIVMRGRMRGGESTMSLRMNGDGTWTLHSRLRTIGLVRLFRNITIDEHTDFRIENGRLVPLLHRYDFDGGRRDRDFEITFDWVERRASGSVRGEWVEIELPPGSIDRHAVPISLILDLAEGRIFPKHLVLIDRGRIRHFEVSIAGERTLDTAVGTFRTTHIVQQRLDDPDRRFLVWLAPEIGNIPVKIQSVDDDGVTITMEIVMFSGG